MTTEERFWAKVVMGYGGECFEWAGAKTSAGYGELFVRKVKGLSTFVYAHRYAWELMNGSIPEGMHILHRCDNPGCVRVGHLFLGTHKENMQDAWCKGRVDRGPKWYAVNLVAQRRRREKGTSTWVRGEDVGNHKLSEADVLKIQEMKGSAPSTEIAPLFGLHSSTIRRIWHRQTWAHLALIAACFLSACARTDIFWPPDGKSVVVDDRGRPHRPHGRAIVLNGSDALGATHVRLAGNTLEFSTAGGIDNSTTTLGWQRTIRHGVGAAAWAAGAVGVASVASNAYSANQAAAATSNAAASKAASSTAASNNATAVSLAEIQARSAAHAVNAAKALPAAGSVIPATVPAQVIPVP